MTVPDDVYRQARIRAAQQGTSVSALVGEYLRTVSSQELDFARLEDEQRRVQRGISHFRAGDRLERDRIHDRAIR